MTQKFQVGDKVKIKRLDNRTPKEILEGLRLDHPRTIVAAYYDQGTQHTMYGLGTNKMGDVDLTCFLFRAQQLKLWIKGKYGRPRTKRRYRRFRDATRGFERK